MIPPLLNFTVGKCTFRMLLIEGGRFRMGSDKTTDPDAYDDETPPHDVRMPSFYLAEFPVTQAFWMAIMKPKEPPFYFSGENRPAETNSWNDVQEFLKKLYGVTGTHFRLPSEAEWEYAARGGRYGLGAKYAGSPKLDEIGWFNTNSHRETKPAGRKQRNELGLYDMSGNVWEWCEDDWHGNYNNAPDNGSAWIDASRGSDRVYRGGGCASSPRSCRAASRNLYDPDYRSFNLGFRLALSIPAVSR